MDFFEILGGIGVICSIFFSFKAFSSSEKKELKELGAFEDDVLDLEKEVSELKKSHNSLEDVLFKEIAILNKKIDVEVKELKKIIDKNNDNNNNNFMNITKILATLQAKMEIIEKSCR